LKDEQPALHRDLTKDKLDLKKLQKKGYRFSVFCEIELNVIVPSCILCNSRNIGLEAFWVNDREKTVTKYFLCESCTNEFLNLSESDRKSVVEKVIEPRIASIDALPHLKASDLIKRGSKVEF
jgi:hypothetical protein